MQATENAEQFRRHKDLITISTKRITTATEKMSSYDTWIDNKIESLQTAIDMRVT